MPCETGKTRLMVPDKTLTILPPALEGEAGALTELFHIYEAAMKVIAVRLEILDADRLLQIAGGMSGTDLAPGKKKRQKRKVLSCRKVCP